MSESKNGNQVEVDIIPIYYDYILTQSYPVNILVGGRNSGKSFFMEQFANYKLHNSKKYKLLVVEDVETNIGAGVKDGILQRADEFGLGEYVSSTKVPPEVTNKLTGNTVIFKGYHSDTQQKQVKSLNEVTAAWYEEGENITYEQFKALRMQLRGGEPEDRQLFITMNPINEAGFINKEFFQKEPDEVFERFPDGRPKVFVKNLEVEVEDKIVIMPCMVVVTTHLDNPYLTDEQRADIEEYKYTNPDLYKMLAEGKFVKGSGAYFPEFEKHIHVVEPFPIPSTWTRYRSLDYGLDKTAVLWYAVDPNNDIYVYKELHEGDLIISEAAERIKKINGIDSIRKTYAPTDLWSRDKVTGRTIADTFNQNGIYFTKASRDRVPGWLAVKEMLKVLDSKDVHNGDPIKTSKLKIFSNCETLIKHIPQVQRDESDPNDMANEPHELTHILDALRYFCYMKYTGFVVVEEGKPKESENTRVLVVTKPDEVADDYINMRVR